MSTQIINRGRGPEIAGTRITVYDVMDYLKAGWRYDQIRVSFVSRRMTSKRPSSISRTTAVMSTYQQILAQHRHVQYPPEVEAKLVRNRQKAQGSRPNSGPASRQRAAIPAIMADHDCDLFRKCTASSLGGQASRLL